MFVAEACSVGRWSRLRRGLFVFAASAVGLVATSGLSVAEEAVPAQRQTSSSPAPGSQNAAPAVTQHFDINEYRVEGTHILSDLEIEEVLYPFLGPGRSTDDVEKARKALQDYYASKGYQTVAIQIPPQHVVNGVVTLKIVENKIGRLRVKGSRYYSLNAIKSEAPSLTPGAVPDFNAVSSDIVALNQQPDRRITPALRAGATPGTVDVDLNVDDHLPLHANLEINDRYSQGTTPLRLNGSVHYDNLWQLGHSLTVSFQAAPENLADAKVFSASYLARIPSLPFLSFLAYGLSSDSNVSTLGDANVAGRGQVIGGRAVMTLPSTPGFYETLSVGLDYKHFDENLTLNGTQNATPITYYPVSATYNATWQGESSLTQLNANFTMHLRGMGSGPADFDAKRFDSSGDFAYFKADLSETWQLPKDYELFAKLQGQVANEPLVNSEQFSAGGQDTVRGYLESEVLGDNGILGTLEMRSPRFGVGFAGIFDDFQVLAFADGGRVTLWDPLPEQQSQFDLASVGLGARVRLLNHINGAIDYAMPLISQSATLARQNRIEFRVSMDL